MSGNFVRSGIVFAKKMACETVKMDRTSSESIGYRYFVLKNRTKHGAKNVRLAPELRSFDVDFDPRVAPKSVSGTRFSREVLTKTRTAGSAAPASAAQSP